jgi:hypothetical protein
MTVRPYLGQLLSNLEERGWWVSGRFRDEPEFFVEFGFEDALQVPERYWVMRGVAITYLAIHGRRTVVTECFLGRWTPPPPNDDITMLVAQICHPLRNYRPREIRAPADPLPFIRHIGGHTYAL